MTKGTSRASKPRTWATKSSPEAGTKAKPGASESKVVEPASRLIDQRIRDLGGWRGEALARMRALILEADPEMTEEWKWMGTPVWSHRGIVCTGEAYTKVVKLTFALGARIPDPSRLFNSSLAGHRRRAIDIHEGEQVDAGAFKALVKAAVIQNGRLVKAKPVKLLSGGNPQIGVGHLLPTSAARAPLPGTTDHYIRSFPPEIRAILTRIRATIREAAPDATERMSYRMPAFFQDGALVYFAAFKQHIGLFPPVRAAALQRQLTRYAGPKGNLRFPLDAPIPYALITKVVKARLRENRERTTLNRKKTRTIRGFTR